MLLLCLLACRGDSSSETEPTDPSDGPTTPVDTDEPTVREGCVADTFDWNGGTLQAEGARLDIPVDALAENGALVELCQVDDTVWEVGPPDLGIDNALILTLDHAGREETTALFTPGPDEVWRNLQATRPATGQLSGPIYRPGQAWVADDPRILAPYEPLITDEADLLFVVDNSGSMSDDHQLMIDAFTQVIPTLDATGLDYHVGVITMDMLDPNGAGQLREAQGLKWVDPDTPNPANVFRGLADLGISGSGLEQGLATTYYALEDLRDTANAGFYREDATLAVVAVTDEDDATDPALLTGSEFVSWLEGLKFNAAQVALHAVLSPGDGATYVGIANQTGGRVGILELKSWVTMLLDVISDLQPGDLPMPLVAADGSIEAWHVPPDAEQQAFAPEAVAHDPTEDTVEVDHDETALEEVFLLYLPE